MLRLPRALLLQASAAWAGRAAAVVWLYVEEAVCGVQSIKRLCMRLQQTAFCEPHQNTDTAAAPSRQGCVTNLWMCGL